MYVIKYRDDTLSNVRLHSDDTIQTVKTKIFIEMQKIIPTLKSIYELYLFCETEEEIDPISIYQLLTKREELVPLTHTRLMYFLKNIVPIPQFEEKSEYTFDDFMHIVTSTKYRFTRTLGQKFFVYSNEYPYVCNPSLATDYDDYVEEHIRKPQGTINSYLLLNTGIIDTIYVAYIGDLLASRDNKYIFQIYFPELLEFYDIDTAEALNANNAMIDDTRQLISRQEENYRNVDCVFDIYEKRKDTQLFNVVSQGINYIYMTIISQTTMEIPLELIFKLLHSSARTPFIKYNPGDRMENIYRLYASKKTVDGKKIPYLHKPAVFKIMKEIGKSKSVSVFCLINNSEITDDTEDELLICEFEENGNINIKYKYASPKSIEYINELVIEYVNPIILEIKQYLQNNNYYFSLYKEIHESNIDVNDIVFSSTVNITKEFKIDQFAKCITSIFNVELSRDTNVVLRLKRVANFNEMESKQAFIYDQLKNKEGLRNNEIIDALVGNYNMQKDDALSFFLKIVGEMKMERGIKKRERNIKENPGFKTEINKVRVLHQRKLVITIKGINNILYLQNISVYIDTLVRLSQGSLESTTDVDTSAITRLCKSAKQEEVIKDVVVAEPEDAEEDINDDDYDQIGREFVFDIDDADYEYDDDVDDIIDASSLSNEQKDSVKDLSVKDLFKDSLKPVFFDDDDDEDESEHEPSGERNNHNVSQNDSVNIDDNHEAKEDEEDEGFEEAKKNTSPPNKAVNLQSNRLQAVDFGDDEEEDEDEDDEEMAGGAKDDIIGMKLHNPTPFFKRMKELEPELFGKKTYSRNCGTSDARQPVILTDAEIQEVKEEERKMLLERFARDNLTPEQLNKKIKESTIFTDEYVLRYGTTDKKYNYMCPKYWCMQTNKPINPIEMILDENGNLRHPTCGGIIKEGQDVIKNDGNYVYEFKSKYRENERMYPGFLKKSMIPCCFKTPKHGVYDHMEEKGKQPPQQPQEEQEMVYIKSPDKFPLEENRWGYMPLVLQDLFQSYVKDYFVNITIGSMKLNTPFFLRHGIEQSELHSFISCIRDILYYKKDVHYTIQQMKEHIVRQISLDTFITLQNASLITTFSIPDSSRVDCEKYKKTNLYTTFADNKDGLRRIVGAYENYLQYLLSGDELIDYTYLWDVICEPNSQLFPKGVNMLIFEITEVSLNVICPSNHFANNLYCSKKPSVFIIKKGNTYEPIYIYYKVDATKITIKKYLNDNEKTENILSKIIKPYYNRLCKPIVSESYAFKRPVIASQLIQLIKEHIPDYYPLIAQTINIYGKVIGLYIARHGFIPCFPSSATTDKPIFLISKFKIKPYAETLAFLKEVSRMIPKANVKPLHKIIDNDGNLLGIMTEGNQFIKTVEQKNINDDEDMSSVINANYRNYSVIENQDMLGNMDTRRINYINSIKLETQFYNAFRTTIKILVNRYENREAKKRLETEINNNLLFYKFKLKTISEILKTLSADYVEFVNNFDSSNLSEITTCINGDGAKYCRKQGDINILLIPMLNLINHSDNSVMYYTKLADELIRYTRVQEIFFRSNVFTMFNLINYKLREDEIIVIESILKTKEFFDLLVPADNPKQVTHLDVTNVEPLANKHNYDKTLVFNQFYQEKREWATDDPEEDYDIVEEMPDLITTFRVLDKITSTKWRPCFPANFKELDYTATYPQSKIMGFHMVVNIFKNYTHNNMLTVDVVRRDLYSCYNELLKNPANEEKVYKILKKGEYKAVEDIRKFVFSEDFYITNLDLLLLMNYYKIPSIIISANGINLVNKKRNAMCLFRNGEDDNFVFILAPSIYEKKTIPNYSVIYLQDGNHIMFPITVLKNQTCREDIGRSLEDKPQTIEEVLEGFNPNETQRKHKAK